MTNPHKQSAEDKIVSSIEEVLRIELCDFSDESGEYYRTDTVKRLIYSFAKQEVKKSCEEQRERCADEHTRDAGNWSYVNRAIRNAPEPKI